MKDRTICLFLGIGCRIRVEGGILEEFEAGVQELGVPHDTTLDGVAGKRQSQGEDLLDERGISVALHLLDGLDQVDVDVVTHEQVDLVLVEVEHLHQDLEAPSIWGWVYESTRFRSK
jgi:hypothetical protein